MDAFNNTNITKIVEQVATLYLQERHVIFNIRLGLFHSSTTLKYLLNSPTKVGKRPFVVKQHSIHFSLLNHITCIVIFDQLYGMFISTDQS